VPKAALYVDPYTTTVGAGQVFTLPLRARRMVDMYGGQLAVTYDPRVLQVVDQDQSRPGAQIKPGDFPVPDTILRNAANNTTGKLEYYFTLTGEKAGVSGSGVVAHMVFRGAAAGRSLVAITETLLSDPQSLPIPTKTENALVEVLSGPVATIQGEVELERRPTSAGAIVCAASRCVTTAADGRFTLPDVPTGRPVEVTHPSYLRASRLVPAAATGTVSWPKVTLLGGDFDKDDRVDIVDAVMVGQRFNLAYDAAQPSPRWLEACDVTDDDRINILDMVAVQFNFLKTAPVPWPGAMAATGEPGQSARVELVPADATAEAPDQDVRLELRVSDVEKLYGFRVKVRFDPEHLMVRDLSPSDEGAQVEVGEFLDPLNSFVLVNKADNTTGVLDLAVTQTAPTVDGVSGAGLLGAIIFRGRAAGSSQVEIEELVLVDDALPIPQRIPASQTDASVTIGGGAMEWLLNLPWLSRP
jgi:hypothetical protein